LYSYVIVLVRLGDCPVGVAQQIAEVDAFRVARDLKLELGVLIRLVTGGGADGGPFDQNGRNRNDDNATKSYTN